MSLQNAKVHSLDVSEEFIGIARKIIEHAGIEKKIDINLGNAMES